VTAVRVYLCSIDGTSRKLLENTPGDGFTTRNVVYDIPHGTDTKYAGSHAQDMGCGIVTDTGTDLKPAGISAATMSDAERAMAYMLGGSGTWQYLEFEIDCTGNVTLNYPTFYASKTGWTVICENGHHQILLRANGPALRIGQLTWNSGNSLITPPAVKDFPGKMSVIDWLCTKRALCGADPHTGVTTEMASLYDSYEGQSVSNGSATCYAFLLPIGSGGTVRAALVNTYSEAPPLPHFPRMERDPVTWLETGDYGLYAYEQAQGPRYLVSNKQTDLYDGSTKWTSPSAITVAGFSITEHSNAVDNTETGFLIVDASGNIAEVRPWHGWLFSVIGEDLQGGTVAYAVSGSKRHAVANIVDGELWFGWTGNSPKPLSLTTADTGIAADWVAIRWTAKDELIFWTEEAGSVKQRTWTGSFSVATTIATGKKPAACIAQRGLRYIYWIDGTAIKGQIRDSQNNIVVSAFTAIASGVDDNGIAADWSPSQAGGFSVILWYTASGSLTQAVSTDGQTFS
jgi:hypothetical protein